MADKKVTIQFTGVFDKASIDQMVADLKKVVNTSDLGKSVKTSTNTYVKSITDAAAEIEKIKGKPLLDSKDLSDIKKYTDQIDSAFKKINSELSGSGAAPSKLTGELKQKIKDINDAANILKKNVNAQFSGEMSGGLLGSKLDLSDAGTKITELTYKMNALKQSSALALGANSKDPIGIKQAEDARKLQLTIDQLTTSYQKYGVEIDKISDKEKIDITTAKRLATQQQNRNQTAYNLELAKTASQYNMTTAELQKFVNEVNLAQQATSKATAQQETFGKTMGAIQQKIAQVTSVIFIMRQAYQTLREGITIVSALDHEMTEIGVVSKKTNDEMWSTFDTFNQLARNLSTTTQQYLEGAKIFYQQGYDTAEVIAMVDATTKAAALSSVSFKEASEALTAAIRAYSMEASAAASITDKYAAVGAYSAADFRELSVAMEKVASSAYTAGMSFDSTLGILAKGIETTREAPEAIGTALKTIVARFQEMKTNPLADLGEGVDANRVEKALKTIGVALRDTTGQFRDLDDVFNDLGAQWVGLSRNQKAYIATMAAGARQQSRFMAIMNDYDRTLELVRMSTNSGGEANRQYAIYEDSIEAATNRMKNAQEAFYVSVTSSDAIKWLKDAAATFFDTLTALNPILLTTIATTGLLVSIILKYIVVKGGEKAATEAGTLAHFLSNSTIFQSIGRTLGLAGANEVLTGTATSATAATLGLSAAVLTVVAAIAILSIAVVLIIKNLEREKNLVHEIAAEKTKLATSERENANNLQAQTARYQELDKKLERTNEEQAEYLELIKQIATIAPELVVGIDAEGNAILARNDILKESILAYRASAREAEIAASEARLASMAQAEWNASMEQGAAGQKTADVSSKISTQLDNIKKMTTMQTNTSQTIGLDGVVKNIETTSKTGTGGFFGENWGVSSVNKSVENAIQEGMAPDKIHAIAEKTLSDNRTLASIALTNPLLGLLAVPLGQSFRFSSEQEQLIMGQIDKTIETYKNYLSVRLAETKIEVARELNKTGQLDIQELEDNYVEVSDVYKNIVAELSATASQMAVKEGDILQQQTQDIIEKAPGIYAELYAKLKLIRGKNGFEEGLAAIADIKTKGGSMTEIKDALDKFFNNYEVPDNLKGTFSQSFINDKQFSAQINKVFNLISKDVKNTKEEILGNVDPISEENLKQIFSNMPSALKDSLLNAIDRIDDPTIASEFIKMVDKVFSDENFSKSFNTDLSSLDKNDPVAIENLTQKLINQIINVTGVSGNSAKEMADVLMNAELYNVGKFLELAKTAYGELIKLNELSKKSLTGAITLQDAFDLAKSGNADAIITLPNGETTVSQVYLQQEAVKKEAEVINDLNGEILALEKTRDSSGEKDQTIIDNINAQISGYQRLVDQLKIVTAEERVRAENVNVLSGIAGINSTVSSLKDFGSVFTKLNSEEGIGFLDILDSIGTNPDLLLALENVNGQFTLSKEKILQVAEAKKAETLTTLVALKAETFAQYQFLKAITETQRANGMVYSLDPMNIKDEELKNIDAMIYSLQNLSLEELLVEKKATKAEKEFQSFLGQFDQFYNILKKIDSLEREMSTIDTQISLTSTGGVEDLSLLKQKMTLLNTQVNTTKLLIDRQEQSLALAREDMSQFSGYVEFANGELVVRWDRINAMKITTEEEKIWYDQLLASIDAYDNTDKALDENIQKLNEYTKAIEEANKALTDEIIDTRQQIYDALVEADQKEVDEVQEKFDKMKELEDDYLSNIKKAIDKERALRNESQQKADLNTKKRKLAALERDTSGRYAGQAATLRAEIQKDTVQQQDDRIDKQLSTLEEQVSLAQEQRDNQVNQLQQIITFKQENRVYWTEVDKVIEGGSNKINTTLLGTNDYLNADSLKQADLAKTAGESSNKLDQIYKTGDGTNVVAKLQSGISATIRGGINVIPNFPGYEEQSLSAVNDAANAAWAAYDQLVALNAKDFGGGSSSNTYNTNWFVQSGEQAQTYDVENAMYAFLGQDGNTYADWLVYRMDHYGFKEGGLVNYTGPAMVHGTTEDPEAFLDSKQTKLFANLRDVLVNNGVEGMTSGNDNSVKIGDINITLQNPVNGSPSDIGKAVRKEILDSFQGRISTPMQRTRI